MVEGTGLENRRCGSIRGFESHSLRHILIELLFLFGMQKYPSGRRGSPAKGVGRETVARVQIPPSAPSRRERQFAAVFLSGRRLCTPRWVREMAAKKFLDSDSDWCYNPHNFIGQTVEAEITATMPPQRARGAESRVGNRSSNGPLRARGTVGFRLVFRDVRAYVSCRGYAGIPTRARRHGRESRWHRG